MYIKLRAIVLMLLLLSLLLSTLSSMNIYYHSATLTLNMIFFLEILSLWQLKRDFLHNDQRKEESHGSSTRANDYISQEPCLFKISIKDDILYGLDKARYSVREVIKAAKLANIDDFIQSLPEGYNTQVGDRGAQMSGGQKQRIAIARTMIRNPTILILDEATSALDSEGEALVNQALDKASKGKTCIKIAHRLSTVQDSDQIAVVEKGQVVEIGAHDELMALGKKGHYYKLMQKQEFSS